MNIKKFLVRAAASAIVLGSMAIPALAAPGGKDSPANDNPKNLYLYPKNTTTWEFDFSGAWGKYNYKLSDEDISGVFNGHGLVPGTDYTLLSYNDPWPGYSFVVIGTGTADVYGDVHISGPADLGTDVDSTSPFAGPGDDGYKIWLVPSSNVAGNTLTWSNMGAYLWEHNLIP